MPERRDGGIGLLTALFLTSTLVVGTFAVAALTGLLGALLSGREWATAFETARHDPLLRGLAQLVGAAIAIAFGVGSTREDQRLREVLAIRPVPSAVAVLSLTAGLALAFPLREVALLFADLVPALAPDPRSAQEATRQIRIEDLSDAFIVPLAFVAIPAVAEELFFRGLILPGLARAQSPRRALWTSAVLFGLIHLEPIPIVYATLAGLALGWLRLRAGSVVPCVALHGAVNATPVLMPPELLRLRGFNTVEADVYHLPLALVLGSALLTFACFAVIARLYHGEPDD